MTTLSICAECKGKGTYRVYNAYDPNNVEEVFCEHCDGDGLVSGETVPKQVSLRPREDDWTN